MNNRPFSQTTEAGELVFTSGHVGRLPDGTPADQIVEQTRLALAALESSLQNHGLTRESVVRATVYLANFKDRVGMNQAYAGFFTEPYPARSTVGVDLPEGLLVEIDAVARIGGAGRTDATTEGGAT